MRRFALLCSLLFAALLIPAGTAMFSANWSVDLGPGYITTSPVTDEQRVYVRTSGFWTGAERPEVKAFSYDGSLEWTYRSNTTTQHDMAPLVLKNAGTGSCGSWPDLLLVGWANGDFTALHTNNGTLGGRSARRWMAGASRVPRCLTTTMLWCQPEMGWPVSAWPTARLIFP